MHSALGAHACVEARGSVGPPHRYVIKSPVRRVWQEQVRVCTADPSRHPHGQVHGTRVLEFQPLVECQHACRPLVVTLQPGEAVSFDAKHWVLTMRVVGGCSSVANEGVWA